MTDINGWEARMTINGNVVEFISSSITEVSEIIQDDGLRGTRTRQMERVALGQTKVGGDIVFSPTQVELGYILPYALNSSSANYTLTDQMADVTIVLDLGARANIGYTYVGRFSMVKYEGGPGEKMKLTVSFVGKTLAIGSGGTISTAADVTQREYMFSDSGSGITIGGTQYSFDKFEFTCDNKINPTFLQGRTATDLESSDRVITLACQTKYTPTESGLLVIERAGPIIGSPLTASIAFTNGTNTLSFTFAALVATPRSAAIPGRDHVRLPLEFYCFGVGANKEMILTNS